MRFVYQIQIVNMNQKFYSTVYVGLGFGIESHLRSNSKCCSTVQYLACPPTTPVWKKASGFSFAAYLPFIEVKDDLSTIAWRFQRITSHHTTQSLVTFNVSSSTLIPRNAAISEIDFSGSLLQNAFTTVCRVYNYTIDYTPFHVLVRDEQNLFVGL